MNTPRKACLITLAGACFALAACDSAPGTAPGAVSEGEAQALEEAAEMLDEQRLPDAAVPDIDRAGSDGDLANGANSDADNEITPQ